MAEISEPSKAERKKARRRDRKAAERAEGRRLEELADAAVASAMELAPDVAAASNQASSERAIDIEVTTVDAARFARKRINEALAYEEWLDVVEAWVWEADTSVRPALTEHGAAHGIELRLEQVSPERR
jgi:hypothetical protein